MAKANNSPRHHGRKRGASAYNLGWAIEDPPERDGLRVSTWYALEADDRSVFNLGNGGRRVTAKRSSN